MRLSPGLAVIICAIGALVPLHSYTPSDDQAASKFAWFVDVTSSRAVHFQYLASHTSRKYLPETMGAGVALFDYDNDGKLDLFLVNGAPLADPTAKGTVPEKSGPKYWNRLFHQKADGTFTDVTDKAGVAGSGWSTSAAWVDLDNRGLLDLVVLRYVQWDFGDVWCGEHKE